MVTEKYNHVRNGLLLRDDLSIEDHKEGYGPPPKDLITLISSSRHYKHHKTSPFIMVINITEDKKPV